MKKDRAHLLSWVKKQLEFQYGPIEKNQDRTPLMTLIQTVLSQNTNDNNRDKAEKELWNRFDDYREIANSSEEEIADAIKTGGLQKQKARTIKGILQSVEKDGKYTLSHFNDLEPESAWKKLMEFDGVGKKTAAVVALFALDKPIFPVDTHVRRVTSRLGLVREGEKHHETLTGLVPDEDMYQLHLHIIRHGRETCKARKPRCKGCILLQRCPTGQDVTTGVR